VQTFFVENTPTATLDKVERLSRSPVAAPFRGLPRVRRMRMVGRLDLEAPATLLNMLRRQTDATTASLGLVTLSGDLPLRDFSRNHR